MNILEELYNGNIAPMDRLMCPEGRYKKLNANISDLSDILVNTLDEKQKNLFENISNSTLEATYITEKENFIDGFRLGAKVMYEILNYKSENFEKI